MNDSICSIFSDKIKRLFHWGPITTLWIIFFITLTSLYNALHVASPCSSFFGLLLTTCILTSFYITLKSYFCAVFLGPGFVPLYWRPFPSLLLRRFPSSILFVIADLMVTLFALGLAVGVTLSVGILAIFQLKAVSRNQTGIESWIVSKANVWRKDIGEKQSFRYPYDLGKLANLQQVFSSSGTAVGDGYYWPVAKGCTQYDLTLEQIYQKKLKQQIQRTFKITQNYDGSWCMCLRFGCLTVIRSPCFDEPRIPVHIGDSLLVTRGTKYWIYGHLIHSESSVGDFSDESIKIRGWVPRVCAFEMNSKHKNDKLEFSLKDD
ncbi:Palmitoyltransferase ZDHHC6 [Schistosoma japonicum]|nr:Palmitoyltransferase ZDHHC6 [Schistosoma japonicum]